MKVDNPVAKLLARYFCVSTPERKIDHSPGVSQGELEHFSRDAAVEYLLMPERVKKLEGQVQVLHVDLEELTGTLKKFLNVERSVHLFLRARGVCRTMFLSDGRES